MTGQRLTGIAQAAFCVLLGAVVLGIGHDAPRTGRRASRAAAIPQEVASSRRVAARIAPASTSTEPVRTAHLDAATRRTRITLRSDDGTVWEVEYEVARGDALGAIADRFGVPVTRIMIVNGIRNPHRIRAGERLRIPLEIEALDHAIMAQLPPALRDDPERLRLAPHFDHWAGVYDIDPDLLKAVGWVESRWRYDVVSHKGAIGIGQLMPATVRFVGRLLGERLDPWTPEQNIQMSARFLRYLLDETDDVDAALAAYYQGLGALRSQGMYRDTPRYVRTVQSARRYFTAS